MDNQFADEQRARELMQGIGPLPNKGGTFKPDMMPSNFTHNVRLWMAKNAWRGTYVGAIIRLAAIGYRYAQPGEVNK